MSLELQYICKNCGVIGKPMTHTKGSIAIEIVLWLLFLAPGLVYSVWRLTTRAQVCRGCGSDNRIPVDTPIGRKLRRELAD